MVISKAILTIKEKTRKLVSNGAAHVLIGSFITKFITFFGSIFLVRILTKSEYGVLSYYENILGYFCVFAGLGLAPGIQRYLILADTNEAKRGCFNKAFHQGNLWNMLLVVLCMTFCFLYKHPEAFSGYPIVILCLTLCIPLIFICNLGQCALRALFDYKRYAYLAVISALILVSGRVVGAIVGGLDGSVTFRLAAEVICSVMSVYLLLHFHFRNVKGEQLDPSFSKEYSNYSVQLMLTDGLWAIFMLNDIFLLGQISGDDLLVADYKIAYVIPANLAIISSSIGLYVAPYFTKYDKEGKLNWVKKNLKLTLLVTMFVMGGLALLCYVFGDVLIKFIFGAQYLTTVPIMNILLIASFFNNGIRMVIANILSAIGEQKKNLIVAGIGMVFQIVLDVLLIPRMGAIGVGLSSLSIYLIMSALLVIMVYKKYFKRKVVKHE